MKIQHSTFKIQHSRHHGMAMLVVLFMVMAVAVIGSGILYRADMAVAGGQNYVHRTQADYLAWGGLEHARALIADAPNEVAGSVAAAPFTLDDTSYYILTITDSGADHYAVVSESHSQRDDQQTVLSKLFATVIYDPNDQTTRLLGIRRSQ